MKEYNLWQTEWKGIQTPIKISLPDSWNVEYREFPADSMPEMTEEQMREAICHPIGSRTLREMAETGHEAAIVFDDLSRGTKCGPIAEIVLAELEAGGISKDHVRFICALGTHAPLSRAQFVAKLNERIVEEYPVYNHNCFDCVTNIGTNAHGDPVEINKEFMDCDIKIGIGACTPHIMNGYGGGGKLLFPGISSIRTTKLNHERKQFTKIGSKESCGMRDDIEVSVCPVWCR